MGGVTFFDGGGTLAAAATMEFGTSPGGFKETLHQACARAEGGIISFLAGRESVLGSADVVRTVACSSCHPGVTFAQRSHTMARPSGQLRLGAFFNPTGHHVASWRH